MTSTSACATSTTRRSSASNVRAGSPTTIRSTNQLQVSGYGGVPENLGVKGNWRNFNPRTGVSYRFDDAGGARRLRVSTIPFGDNTYAFNFPVKQNNQFTAANAFVPPAGVSMAAGSRRRSWPRSRRAA